MTPYTSIYSSFMDLVIKDDTFFKGHPEEILETRMYNLMDKAVTSMYLIPSRKDFEINFLDIRDDDLKVFNETLNNIEINLIARFMFQEYIEQDVVQKIKALKTLGFSSKEISSFSPANSLKQFDASFSLLKSENASMLTQYKNMSRTTLKRKKFDYQFD